MIDHLVQTHRVDPARVFITGFSAGGAMAASMLATYPEMFEAGAVLAGLAVGIADSVPEALDAMAKGDHRSGPQAAAAVLALAQPPEKWPRLLVWHGLSDDVVVPDNAGGLVRQWRHLHGLPAVPDLDRWLAGGRRRRIWRDAQGRDAIEYDAIVGLGHMLMPQSTATIAAFFGLKTASFRERALEKWSRLTDMRSQIASRSKQL